MALPRRTLFRRALLVAGGAAAGVAAVKAPSLLGPGRLPLDGGYAPAADHADWVRSGQLDVTWHVETEERVIAFTFDDGPGPRWTTQVLDALDYYGVPATFFMVGRRLNESSRVVAGRLSRHEVGNHSWSHADLATLDAAGVRNEITRTHEAIQRHTGREATLLRPPYGHIGGATLLAAQDLNYEVVLWSQKMNEQLYEHNPAGQVAAIVNGARPGAIVLAHDVGAVDRLVALDHLGEMFTGLKALGYRFVTVSELMSGASSTSGVA